MLLSLQNISFYFGARPILEDASWQIHRGERIGLIGPNGTGKSTLLRLIMGQYTPDGGLINKPKDTTLGFFNQDLLSFSTDESIHEVGMHAFDKAKEIEQKMTALLEALESKPDDEKLLDDYSHALHDFEVAGGYEMEHRTAEVLEGLGFSTEDLKRPYNEFSGGWRMRVLLARMMLQAPDLLLLDEPTNHLDLPSIEWLERYLQGYPGSVVIVSHDRYFLDRMVTKIVEVWQRDLIPYTGNYEFYLKEKAERVQLQQRAFENQQDYIKQQERFIERFRAQATKAAQAQSAIKRLDKLDIIESPDTAVPVMRINFSVATTPGKIIATLTNVSKSYPKIKILEGASAEIVRGDKIALIGANGKGKSTLLRIIAGHEKVDAGEAKEGHNVEESFYAQHQLESLNVELEILDEMKGAGTGKAELELRQLLGSFLFSGDNVFKKIKVLSGGEKARVALAKVIAAKANFLMLDEPTNHLDMQSVEMLIGALNEYAGTFIFVSHDRYFIQQTANKIWEIVDGKIKEFPGGYDEWAEWKERAEKAQAVKSESSKAGKSENQKTGSQQATNSKQSDSSSPKSNPQQPAPQKQPSNNRPTTLPQPSNNRSHQELQNLRKEHQKAQKQFEKLEADLTKMKSDLAALELRLADPNVYANATEFQKLDTEYRAMTAKVEAANKQYDTAFEKVMELEEKIG